MLELSDLEDTENIPDSRTMFAILLTDNERLIFHIRAGIAAADAADARAVAGVQAGDRRHALAGGEGHP